MPTPSPQDTECSGTARPYLEKLTLLLSKIDDRQIDDAVSLIVEAWQTGRQVITLGNGGSALTAIHMATDWSKGISMATGRRFRGRSLVDNMGIVTAYGNDVSYQEIFTEQLKHLMEPGDLVIAISGSGNSPNVISAIEYANQNGAVTLGLCGFQGGKLRTTAQHVVWACVDDMQLCEDIHAIFGHIVMQKLCGMV